MCGGVDRARCEAGVASGPSCGRRMVRGCTLRGRGRGRQAPPLIHYIQERLSTKTLSHTSALGDKTLLIHFRDGLGCCLAICSAGEAQASGHRVANAGNCCVGFLAKVQRISSTPLATQAWLWPSAHCRVTIGRRRAPFKTRRRRGYGHQLSSWHPVLLQECLELSRHRASLSRTHTSLRGRTKTAVLESFHCSF